MATASAVPTNAERTGTAVRPRPGSRAKRTPTTPATGIPAASAPRVMLERRVVSLPGAGHPMGRPSIGRARPRRPRVRRRAPPGRCRAPSSQRRSPVGVDGAHRSERGERREPDRHGDGQQRAEDHRGQDADQPVTSGGGRTGPEGAQHLAVLVSEAQLAGNGLHPEDQADQGGDRPERAKRDRLRLDGELHLGHDPRGHVELIGEAPAG